MRHLEHSRAVDAVRRFNRFYTHRIGVLDRGLLDSPYSLTEVRVLYEIAHRDEPTASEIAADLRLDLGYLSRMLARFHRQRLIQRRRSADDARQVHLRLTARGREVFTDLDHRSSRQVSGLLQHLGPTEEKRLLAALETVHHLLSPADKPVGDVVLRAPEPGDLGWVVQRHGALYATEYGWNQDFEALVAQIVADYSKHLDPSGDRCWIATLGREPVGCVFLVRKTATVAKLRLLLVEPSARGRGVGVKLVQACIDFAREAKYRKIELWTNSVLHSARRIYERAGFKLVGSEQHHSFGADLTGETWELDLG